MDTIGQRIRKLREARGLSQRALGKLCGCSGPAISDLENGHTAVPSAKVLTKMSEVLGKSQRFILYGEDGDLKVPTKEQERILATLEQLTPEQTAAVLAIIETMAKPTR